MPIIWANCAQYCLTRTALWVHHGTQAHRIDHLFTSALHTRMSTVSLTRLSAYLYLFKTLSNLQWTLISLYLQTQIVWALRQSSYVQGANVLPCTALECMFVTAHFLDKLINSSKGIKNILQVQPIHQGKKMDLIQETWPWWNKAQ